MSSPTNPGPRPAATPAGSPGGTATAPGPKESIIPIDMLLTPPEERFWRKYSGHHEFPLSWLATILLHVGFVICLALALNFGGCVSSDSSPLEIDSLDIGEGGSGGDPNAEGSKNVTSKDLTVQEQEKKPEVVLTPQDIKPVEVPKDAPIEIDPNAQKTVEEKPTESLDEALTKVLNERARGDGQPEGDGGAGGNKSGFRNKRTDRILRWRFDLSFSDYGEYARKLYLLDAYVGYAKAPNNVVQVYVIKDLRQRPVNPEIVRVSELGRLFMADVKAENAAGLLGELGVKPPYPKKAYIFWTRQMEEQVLDAELKFASKFGIKSEEELSSTLDNDGTQIEVRFVGNSVNFIIKSVTAKDGKVYGKR